MEIKKPSVAGMFYPGKRQALKLALDKFFAFAQKEVSEDILNKTRNAKVFIVPHAGYQYSGFTAACAYWVIKHLKKPPKRVVIMGPAHRIYFKGVVVAQHDAWENPLGELAIDKAAGRALIGEYPDDIHGETSLFDGEHSLEVQVPFLQAVIKDCSLVPIMYSDIASDKLKSVFYALENEETIFVVSSDLSHFLPYSDALKIDCISNELIRNFDVVGAEKYLDACGKIGVIAAMRYAKKTGLTSILVNYMNSGDTQGDKDSVVGYATHIFY